MQKIISLVLLLLVLPVVSAEVFELPGCIGVATLGVNAASLRDFQSDDCKKVTSRTYFCGCKNGTVSIFSNNDPTEYDLIFQYNDSDVEKIERYDNVVFKETYANKMLTNLTFVFAMSIIVAILLPLGIILLIHLKNGKDR